MGKERITALELYGHAQGIAYDGSPKPTKNSLSRIHFGLISLSGPQRARRLRYNKVSGDYS